MRLRLMFGVLCFALGILATESAEAQYKNTLFGGYGGVAVFIPSNNLQWFRDLETTQSGFPLADGSTKPRGTPFALANAFFTFELAFKISLESWFLRVGFNMGFTTVVDDPVIPNDGGIVFMLEPSFGPRYYFVTDNVRPYLEVGIRLGTFIYTTPGADKAMPTNWKVAPAFYGQFGIEFIVARDLAIAITARYARYIIINFPGFNSLEGQAGIVSYF